ncbi:MAG: PAS domain-containing hybrid sensor histidine kinase/response regulator [Planctomycetota bacterium]
MAFVLFLAAFVVYGYCCYRREQRQTMESLDDRLLMAAHAIPEVLGREFFTQATGPATITPEDDQDNIEHLTRLAESLEAACLYTLACVDGQVYITSSSASAEERRTGNEVRYWTPYAEAPSTVATAIASGLPTFADHRDRWGHYRHVYIPLPGGDDDIVHVAAADLESSAVRSALHRRTLVAVLAVLGLFAAGIPLFVAYRSRLRHSLRAVRHSHRALSQSEERFRSFVENANDIVYALAPDGRFTYISPNWLQRIGESPEQALGRSFEPYVHPADVGLCYDFLRRVLETGAQHSSEEFRVRHRDGSWRWYRSNGSPLRDPDGRIVEHIGIARDVTESRQALLALSESDRELRAALRLARVGSWTLDLVHDELLPSPALLTVLGLDATTRSLPIPNALESVHPDDRRRVQGWLARTRTSAEPMAGELRFRRPDGQYIWLLSQTESVELDDNGGTLRCFGVAQDVTGQRQMQERLTQMEKMQAIGLLAGGVAHDFNNQLAGIMGYADLVRMRISDPQLGRAAERILICARRAEELTRQLLAFSRKQDHQRLPVDLHQIIQEVVLVLEHSLDKRITVHQQLAASHPTVLGDPSQIQSAILNLAINARDAMPEGGELSFATATRARAQTVAPLPDDPAPGPYLELRVRDTGTGMPEEVRDRIFEPFFTTKAVGKGTGMGLAAVYGTMANHGGSIAVESEPGSGSCFTILLPVHAGQSIPATQDLIANRSLEGVRVLVIEDEAMLRELASEMLGELGCTVATAEDGAAGLAYYREHRAAIDVVLLDMVMPRMAGSDVLRAIRALDPHARVLVVSGHGSRDASEQHFPRGDAMVLRKPYQQNDLALALQRLLEHPAA